MVKFTRGWAKADPEQLVPITMLRDRRGSPDGCKTVEYSTGETYSVPASLAEAFLSEEAAVEAGPKASNLPADGQDAPGGDNPTPETKNAPIRAPKGWRNGATVSRET